MTLLRICLVGKLLGLSPSLFLAYEPIYATKSRNYEPYVHDEGLASQIWDIDKEKVANSEK
jgi:hypothetical protein